MHKIVKWAYFKKYVSLIVCMSTLISYCCFYYASHSKCHWFPGKCHYLEFTKFEISTQIFIEFSRNFHQFFILLNGRIPCAYFWKKCFDQKWERFSGKFDKFDQIYFQYALISDKIIFFSQTCTGKSSIYKYKELMKVSWNLNENCF